MAGSDAGVLALETCVAISGLVGAPEHNGRTGVVIGALDSQSGRYTVQRSQMPVLSFYCIPLFLLVGVSVVLHARVCEQNSSTGMFSSAAACSCTRCWQSAARPIYSYHLLIYTA